MFYPRYDKQSPSWYLKIYFFKNISCKSVFTPDTTSNHRRDILKLFLKKQKVIKWLWKFNMTLLARTWFPIFASIMSSFVFYLLSVEQIQVLPKKQIHIPGMSKYHVFFCFLSSFCGANKCFIKTNTHS